MHIIQISEIASYYCKCFNFYDTTDFYDDHAYSLAHFCNVRFQKQGLCTEIKMFCFFASMIFIGENNTRNNLRIIDIAIAALEHKGFYLYILI